MKKIILAALLILSQGCATSPVQLEEINVDYKIFSDDTRTPYFQGVPGLDDHLLQSQLDLNVNTDFLEHFYWDNTIHSLNDGQYRLIGWNYRIGLHINEWLDFGFWHFSEHYADFESPSGFPLQNAWQFKIYLFRKKVPGKGLF